MARPFIFPDPKDRSPNEPTIAVQQSHVLGNYNQANPEDKREKVTEPVKDWFKGQAEDAGWSSADFHGSVCVLTADVALTNPT